MLFIIIDTLLMCQLNYNVLETKTNLTNKATDFYVFIRNISRRESLRFNE